MKFYDMVIVDSGLDTNSGINEEVDGLSVQAHRIEPILFGDISDDWGHGTIIYHVIRKQFSECNICVVKLFSKERSTIEDDLIYALRYIKDNIACNVVNLSLGITICDDISELYKACDELAKLGIVIVSAFDNDGCYSFPAAFDNVIGVDSNNYIRNAGIIEYVEGSPINILAKGNVQRVRLSSSETVIVGGSSVACAYVSSMLAKEFRGAEISKSKALAFLKTRSHYIYKAGEYCNMFKREYIIQDVQNVAVFPVSKEMHAFLRYENMLPFCVRHYYDIRYSGRVGMMLNNLYDGRVGNSLIEDIEGQAPKP